MEPGPTVAQHHAEPDTRVMLTALLLEDDAIIARTVQLGLQCDGFEVRICVSLAEARRAAAGARFDIMLLDLQLPDGESTGFCAELRKTQPQLPIIFITARDDEDTAVRTLAAGADDFVRKPFGMKELVARMGRLLRQRSQGSVPVVCGSLRLEPAARRVFCGPVEIALGRKEFDILMLFAEKIGHVITRSDLLTVIDDDGELFDRTIDSHLSHIRKKLRSAGVTDVQIVSVYGVGYRLDPR